MDKKSVKKVGEYWRKTAEHDYDVMMTLFKNKRYDYSLFFGHIVLEKILKALVVEYTNEQAPYTHDLARLAEIGRLELEEGDMDLLNKVNDFNLSTRYPDYKLQFYRKCTKEYTKKYLEDIVKLYRKLCQIKK
ncbi:MAG: HEPN domain-containing protein [bacterium]